MKTNIQNMFSESRSYSDVSLDRRLTVGRPSFDRRSALLKVVAVLVMVFTLGVEQMWGDSYTITFANNASSATALTSSVAATTTIASASRTYVNASPYTVNSGNCYYGDTKTCIRIGKSGASSSLSIALSANGQVSATTIVVNCDNTGGKNNSSATLSVNGASAQTTKPNDPDNYTFTINDDITSITLAGSASVRIYSITVNYTTGGGTPSHTLSSAVSPGGGGSVSLSATSVAEGSTATATATPSTHYTFTSWSISGTGASLSSTTTNPTTVTMGTANAIVTAHFTEDPTYTVTWAAGSNPSFSTQTNYAGTALNDPGTPSTALYCPGGKEFVGWTATPIVGEGSAPADLFTSVSGKSIPAGGTTYYAVFATASGGGSSNGSKTLVSNSSSTYYTSGYITGVAGTNSASWTADAFTMVQYKNTSSNAVPLNYAEIRAYQYHSLEFTPASGTTITSIVVTANSDSYATALGGSSISNCTKSVSGSTVTITPTDGTSAITLTQGAQSRINSIVVNYTTGGGVSYSNYATSCAAACGLPTSPTNGSVTEDSQPVSWTAPSSAPANGYLVAYSGSSTAPGDNVKVNSAQTWEDFYVIPVAAGTTSFTFNASSYNYPGTKYYWWVRSKCSSSDYSGWVAGDAFTIPNIEVDPTAIDGLDYDVTAGGPSTAKTFTVSGSGLTGNLTVALDEGASSKFEISKTSASSGYGNSLTLTPTSGAVSATIWVRLKSGQSSDDYLEQITISGGTATSQTVAIEGIVCSKLAAPTGLNLDENYSGSHGRIRLTWNAVTNASGYRVYMSKNGGSEGHVDRGVDERSYIHTMDPGNYTWRVVALGDGTTYCSEGTAAAGSSFCVGADLTGSTPTGLTISNVTDETVRFSWTAVANAAKYKVSVKNSGTPISGFDNKETTNTYMDVTGLTAGTTYTAEVTAYNACEDAYKSPTASTTIKILTVTFDSDGGDAVATQYVNTGGKATTPSPAPTKACNDLVGWKNGGSAYDFNSAVTTDLSLTADWSTRHYTITYHGGTKGTVGGPISAGDKTCGEAFTLSSVKYTNATEKQDGWATSENGSKVYDMGGTYSTDANIDLYPHWTAKTYTGYRTSCTAVYDIVLDDGLVATTNNGSATVTANSTALVISAAPTKAHYHVEGYYDDNVYTHKVATDAGVLQANVTGFTGAGGAWTKGSGATLYTKWTVNSHTLTWVTDGDALTGAYTNGSVNYGASITAPNTPTKTGYQFSAWSPAVAATMPDEDVTYTATWTANTYSVRFNKNGGSGDMSPQDFTYGVAQNLTSNGFTAPSEKSFGGWTTNSDGTGDFYTNGQEVSNLTSVNGATVDLYAKWVDCDLYTVTLKVNGDTWKTVTQGSCGASIDLSSYQDVPACDAKYTFVGWSTTNPGITSNPAITKTSSYTPESDVTLYAVYSYSAKMGTLVKNTTGFGGAYKSYIIAAFGYDVAMGEVESCGTVDGVTISKDGDYCFKTGSGELAEFYFEDAGSSKWFIYQPYIDSESNYGYVYMKAPTGSGGKFCWYDDEEYAEWRKDDNNIKPYGYYDYDYIQTYMKTHATDALWSLSINGTTGVATLTAVDAGSSTRSWLYNSGATKFSTYTTSQKAIAIYEYSDATAYTTQPDMTVYTITKGAEDAAVGTYTVTPGLVCSGSSVSLSATPTGSNTFIGWESDNGGTFADASSATTTFIPSAATTTVTANFGLAIVLDKNNADGGSADGSAYVTANATSLSGVSAPTRTGYTVEGYYAEEGCTNQVADNTGALQANVTGYTGAGGAWTKGTGATLYAKWTANPHTLTWNFDGGESSLTAGVGYTAGGTVNYGTAITYPTNVSMTKTGYTFNGWSTTVSSMPDDNLTITALWTQKNYTLTMAANPADKGANITSPRTGAGTVDNKHYGDAITVTVTKPDHYTFSGWTSSNGGTFANATALSTTFTMPDNATTVTANFTEDAKFTVTWSDNGDASNTTQVYSGGTTTFPALEGCDMYVAAGWVLDNGTFTEETAVKPGTIYAAGATTPAVSGNVTYKAVYRHKYYTTDEFVLNTTTAGGYYLSVNPGTVRYSGAKSGSKLGTVTNKANAVPVYVEKEAEGQYSFKLVGTTDEQYIVGYNGTDFGWRDTKADDYKWTVADGTQGKGDYHILNAGTNSTRGFIYNNGNGNYIGNYVGSNVTSEGSTYYDMNFVPAYYYKYSPTKACYVITITSNNWSAGEFETIDPSTKVLDGTMLTVKVACGKTISSWSFTSGTATLASGETPEYIGMEGDKEVYRFNIIPTSDATLRINFGDGAQRTISFLDGSTVLGQTKTAAITDKRDCGSYDLPAGYSTASGEGGACTDWTFDGWTATNYTYGQMGTPSDIVAAGTSQDVHGDKTWYAVYHKTFAAGAYFKIKYGDYYIADYGSNQFNTTTTEADGLMFQLEDGYLYYIDKTTRANKWVYFVGPSGQNVTVSDAKPTSNLYKTTFTEDGGVYDIVCNSKHLKLSGDNVKYLTTASGATKPNASAFTAYYPKTDCTIEYVTITYDAGAGNSCSPASASVESGATISLPVEGDITYDNTDWTFVGWSAGTVQGVVPGAPADLLAGGGSYSTFVDVTLHAVYSQVPPDGTFDNTKGGKYIIWGEDGGVNYYAKSNGQKKGKLSNTLACSEAAIFEFVETETAGQYKIHIVGEDKYFAGEGCGDTQTDFTFVAAGSAPVWTVAETATADVWKVTSSCGTRGFIMATGGSKIFGHYASNNTVDSPGSYKDIHIGQCGDYYTTNPNKALSVTGDILVTSTNGRMVMAKDQLTINAGNIGSDAPVTITSNSSDVYFSTTRAVNISKAATPTNSVTINADEEGNITNQTVYVHYMPSVATDGIEEVLVTVTSPEKTVEHTIKVRHLPATFAIAAKVGKNWYALTGNMSGAKTPAAIQIEVDESSWTAYAPDTCAYQLWPVKTTNASGDRYQAQGEKVRFSAVNNKTTANAGLWANNSAASNTINNYAAITAITSDPAAQYEWKIAATEIGSTWKYTLQMEAGTNNNKLNIHRDANLVWGTYTDGQALTSEIYLLPISEITPFEFQVVEWYPTKVLVQTEAALASPSVKIAGEAVASPVLTNKGGKLWEISGLTTLAANPTEMLKINYTKDAVTYSGIKSIPVIISRSTQNVTEEPFTTLTKEVYNYADLVVRDGAVLMMNGTEAENKFYDVTIYPTSKISVPESKKLGVHSLTFFGGIDEIYNGSTYTVNKYGVPELSLKGQFGTKTVTTIDYVMRVDLDQMYQTGVPYDVNLNEITYWDGTAMTPGTDLYVSTYDGQARANKESKTWIWEEDFESKLGAATLKAGVGYTISAELQSGVGSDYSIIRLPMKSNVGSNATEGDKTVPVEAYANTKGETITDNHKGWNYLSNPYMVSISGGEADSKLVVGYLKETGTGPWEWYDDSYRYVTIPVDNGTDYYQQKWTATTLKPFKSFFLQIGTAGDLSFALASRQNMPARYLQAKEREVEFEVLLDNDAQQDHTGFLIADKYTPEYEINADLEKMEKAMSVYTILNGYQLAYNALNPNDAKEDIPVGFIANVAGSYTFSLAESGDVEDVEHIWLTDHEIGAGFTTDLIDDTYSFAVEQAGKNNTRFTIRIELKDEDEVATGIEPTGGGDKDRPLKFLYRDKMYILRNGVIYDATGKKVSNN